METYPVSPSQKRLFFLWQMVPDSTMYNMPRAIYVEGGMDVGKLHKAFAIMIRRHMFYRASFYIENDEIKQKIDNDVPFDFETYSLSECFPEKRGLNQYINDFVRPFDLSKAPLLRARLIEFNDQKKLLLYDMHHIISDGESCVIFQRELIQAYLSKELPELEASYLTLLNSQNYRFNHSTLLSQETYWLRMFQEEVLPIELPLDKPRGISLHQHGHIVNAEFDEIFTDKIKILANKSGFSLFMVLLSAFYILLYKLTGQHDIVVGTPVANRLTREFEKLIGMFVNTLPLRFYIDENDAVRNVINKVKELVLNGIQNQDYPYEELLEKIKVKRELSRNPLFDVFFNLTNYNSDIDVTHADNKFKSWNIVDIEPKFDLSFNISPVNRKLYISCIYNSSLFENDTIEKYLKYYERILVAFVENDINTNISKIDILDNREKEKLLEEFNLTQTDFPNNKVIQALFEEQAEKSPHTVALVYEGEHLTYRELNERSNKLGAYLREQGVIRNTIVGLMSERSLDMITGMLAIIKAGGAYLPIDPEYPLSRKCYLIKDSGAGFVLTNVKVEEELKKEAQFIDLRNNDLSHFSCNNLAIENTPQDIIYCIYTSGSTGKPKGTLIEHYSLVNRLNWMNNHYHIGKQDVFLQKTPFSFDVSIWELFLWMFEGARLSILVPGGHKDPGAIVENMRKHQVSMVHFVPSMLTSYLHYLKDNEDTPLKTLRYVICSGEALTKGQVKLFFGTLGKNKSTRVENLYGPTEATIDVSCYSCRCAEENRGSIPIGKPIDNIRLYVLSGNKQIKPVGIPGELYIAGAGLARGYLNKPELTHETFSEVDFISKKEKLYKTGDIARWLPDGNIEYLGRNDSQVKIRGNRIELGEIENSLLGITGIKEAVVMVMPVNDDHKIVACIVTAGLISTQKVKEYLNGFLPAYMLPSFIIKIDKIPLTPNGKIDKNALLQKINIDRNLDKEYIEPETEIEKQVARTWQELLGVSKIGLNDTFFDLGGHSLLLLKCNQRIKDRYNIHLQLNLFFNQSLQNIARVIEEKVGKNQ